MQTIILFLKTKRIQILFDWKIYEFPVECQCYSVSVFYINWWRKIHTKKPSLKYTFQDRSFHILAKNSSHIKNRWNGIQTFWHQGVWWNFFLLQNSVEKVLFMFKKNKNCTNHKFWLMMTRVLATSNDVDLIISNLLADQ